MHEPISSSTAPRCRVRKPPAAKWWAHCALRIMPAQPCSRGWVLAVSLGNSHTVPRNSDWTFLPILCSVESQSAGKLRAQISRSDLHPGPCPDAPALPPGKFWKFWRYPAVQSLEPACCSLPLAARAACSGSGQTLR
jgi:hypothetical protein